MTSAGNGHGVAGRDAEGVLHTRELFWRNVMREILTSLSVASLNRPSGQERSETDQEGGDEEPDLFDGRLAIMTHGGERIPIADVYPLFACGINTSEADRALSMAVECSVFQVRTPSGEVFTLPLQEMRAFHAMSPELMARLEREAGLETGPEEAPFGFAAFTSLAREEAAEEQARSARG